MKEKTIEFEGMIRIDDSKFFRIIEVNVPDTTSEIVVRFDYTPKISGFENHVNLLIYDSLGKFVARYDRKNSEIVISETSTPGALNVFPIPGTWKFVLENHSINGTVLYKLEVIMRGEEKLSWMTGEMHSHSIHSDGSMSVSELSKHFKDMGLDFFFLTDHTNVSGWRELEKLEGAKGFRGEELNTFHGHALILGADVFIDWKDSDFKPMDISEVYRNVRTAGGLFGVAHPFVIGDPICVGCEWNIGNPFSFDFFEIVSRHRGWEIVSRKILHEWVKELRRGRKVTALSGGDVHEIDDDYLDFPKTEVLVRRLEISEILYAIKFGRIRISNGFVEGFSINGFDDSFTINDHQVEIRIIISERGKLVVFTKEDSFTFDLRSGENFVKIELSDPHDFIIPAVLDRRERMVFLMNPIFHR